MTSIFRKVIKRDDFRSLTELLHTQTKFDLGAHYADHPEYRAMIGSEGRDRRFRNNSFEKLPCFHSEAPYPLPSGMCREGKVAVYGVVKNKRVTRFVAQQYVDVTHGNLGKWKVFVPRANGSGALGEVLTNPIIGEPMVGSTETFISIGSFETQAEAEACLKYVKTKFARAMLGILKVTAHITPDKWVYVPLQDFTAGSDIDWGQSVAGIDRQLYRKYGLSEEEVAFIEGKVKEMA